MDKDMINEIDKYVIGSLVVIPLLIIFVFPRIYNRRKKKIEENVSREHVFLDVFLHIIILCVILVFINKYMITPIETEVLSEILMKQVDEGMTNMWKTDLSENDEFKKLIEKNEVVKKELKNVENKNQSIENMEMEKKLYEEELKVNEELLQKKYRHSYDKMELKDMLCELNKKGDLEMMKKEYSKENVLTTTYNDWLFKGCFIVLGCLSIGIYDMLYINT